MREAILLIAAMGMTVTGSMSSYAVTEAVATAVSYTETNLADGGGADSIITRHIEMTSISVKVPIASSFDIDPSVKIKANDSATTQTGGRADNYIITNLSTVPLEISIMAVAPGVGVNLVDAVNDFGSADKNVLFTIREAKETPLTLPGTKNNKIWMNKTDIKKEVPYYVKGDKAYTTEVADTSAAPNEETRTDIPKMKVYAAATRGWKSGNSFTITPAFTVSLQTEAQTSQSVDKKQNKEKGGPSMTARIPCTSFGKKMRITIVGQDIPRQELVKCLGIANSTVSGIIYGHNQCERAKERIAETLGIKGQTDQ